MPPLHFDVKLDEQSHIELGGSYPHLMPVTATYRNDAFADTTARLVLDLQDEFVPTAFPITSVGRVHSCEYSDDELFGPIMANPYYALHYNSLTDHGTLWLFETESEALASFENGRMR